MGPEILIPALVSAAGTYMQYSAQRDADKARKKQIDAMAAQRAQATNRVVADVEAEAPRYTQQALTQETGEVQAASEDRLLKDLQSALSPTQREVPSGNVSSEYLAKKAERETAEAARGANLAKLFAAIDAPSQTRLKQSLDAADARARRGAIMSGSNAYAQRLGADYESIRPDPLKTTVGGLAIGGAGAYSQMTADEKIKKALQGTQGPTIFNPDIKDRPWSL